MEETKNKGGRPEIYTKELADKLCEKLAQGISLRTACLDDGMPGLTTVFKWMRTEDGFSKQYARAKEESADGQYEILEDIGDEAIQASYNADPKAAGAVVSAYKLKADNLKWTMSKMKPKKYGDKMDVTSGGEAIKTNTIIFKDFSTDESIGE